MLNNSGSLQPSNNLFFSQKIKGSTEKNKDSNLFSSEKHPKINNTKQFR